MSAQLRAAQRYYDNLSPDESDDAREEAVAERAEQLTDAYLSDHDKVREAFAQVVFRDADNLVGLDFATAFCAWRESPDNVLPENIVGRFHTFMRAMFPMIWAEISDEAQTEAARQVTAEFEQAANDAAEARDLSREDWP